MKLKFYLKKYSFYILLFAVFLIALNQHNTINDLRAKNDIERENRQRAFVYIYKHADFSKSIAALEALLDPNIKDVPGAIKGAEKQLEDFSNTLQLLNTLSNDAQDDEQETVNNKKGSFLNTNDGGRRLTEREERARQNAIREINLNGIRFKLLYFDGQLPDRDKNYLKKSLGVLRKIDEQFNQNDMDFERYGNIPYDPANWKRVMASLYDPEHLLDEQYQINQDYIRWKPVNLSKEEAEKSARKALELDSNYKTVENIDAGVYSLPGETTYQFTFQKEQGKELVTFVSAVTGRIVFYYDNQYAGSDQYAGKPLAPELKKAIVEVAKKATEGMGERIVLFSSAKAPSGEKEIIVAALRDGFPDLSQSVKLWVNASYGKVICYQLLSYSDNVPTTRNQLHPEEILPLLKKQGQLLWSYYGNPKYLVGAKVEGLVITYSPYLDKAVLAYEVALNDPDHKVLYVNAETGKLENIGLTNIHDALADGIKIK